LRRFLSFILVHKKAVIIWAAGLIIGGSIALWANAVQLQKDAEQIPGYLEIALTIGNILPMIGLVIAGYFIGRKLEKN